VTNRALSYAELNASRRSWTAFTGALVQPDLLRAIVAEAALAPSSMNLQPWRVVALQGERIGEAAEALGGNADKTRAAGTLLVVLGDPDAVEAKGGAAAFYDGGRASRHDFAVRNASLFAMNLLLAAWSHGVATRPMIGFEPSLLREAVGAPGHWVPVVAIAAGYPDHDGAPGPRERLDVDEVLEIR
jgi:putative NAD(P)H nitroreductase